MNIKLEELIELKACSSGLNRFKSLNLEIATLEQTLSVCTVSDVLWYLGHDQSNLSNIVIFTQWCAKEARYAAEAAKAAKYAAEAARAARYAAMAATNAARYAEHAEYATRYAADAAKYAAAKYAASAATQYDRYDAARTKQKAKLLELFS
jgi:hypothetical protein